MGYKVIVKDSGESVHEFDTESLRISEVATGLQEYAKSSALDLENVPESLTVEVSSADKKMEDSFLNVLGGFTEISGDIVIMRIQELVARLSTVSDMSAATFTVMFKEGGPKGLSVVFDNEMRSGEASAFANATLGHAEELKREFEKKFNIVTQDANPIIVP